MSTPLARPSARQQTIDEDALVLGDRPLRAGVRRASTSRFRDMVWHLSPAIHQKHGKKLILNFARVPQRFRLVTKELFYALLASEPPPGHKKLHIETIRAHFSRVLAFLTWMDQQGLATLASLTAEDLAAYQDHLLKRRGRLAGWRQHQRHAVRLFWVYRSRLAADQLAHDPARLEAWEDESCRADTRENQTARVPEPVLGPLLGWALRWVDEFADDVIRAHTEWLTLNANTGPNRTRRSAPRAHTYNTPQRLEALLARYRVERRPLPRGSRGWVNRAHLARELDIGPTSLNYPQFVVLLNEAVRDLGIADGTWLRTEIRGQLNDRPWRTAIGYEELPILARQLQTACYIVIAYLSGMRDSEVKHLRRGCLTTRRDNTNRAYRWIVTSQAFKGEGTPQGVQATWVVGEPVDRALGVLERLQPSDQTLLFAHLPSSNHFRRQPTDRAKSNAQTRRDLAAFIDWINAHCDIHNLPDRIPLVRGQCWHLTTSQLRRTLAWFIARRPGGVIAGAIQYRHQRIQMFEGYAGTSTSGFRAEVEAEQALERGEGLLGMVEHYEHQQLSGPAAREAKARLEEFDRQAGFAGTVVTDQRRLQLIMRRHDPNMFPGKFVTCVFNPDKAMCLRPKATQHRPAPDDCKPMACRNVALTSANLAAWHEHLARVDRALESAEVLAPYLRYQLEQQRDQITRFLAENDHPPEELA